MKSFREFALQEQTKDKIIYVKDSGELWITYGQGSGQTLQFKNIKSSKNNKSGDKNYDSAVDRIVKWAKSNKPTKANKEKTSLMFEIPVYSHTSNGKYDIWGGDIKPISKLYMVINLDGVNVVQLFDNKNEAQAWIRSL